MKKVFDYITNGGSEYDKLAASHEYLEGVLGSIIEDLNGVTAAIKTAIADIDNGDIAAARDILKTALREPQ